MDPVQSNWSSIMVHLVLCPRTKSSPPNPKVWSTWSNSRIQARRQNEEIDPPKVQGLWSFIRRSSPTGPPLWSFSEVESLKFVPFLHLDQKIEIFNQENCEIIYYSPKFE
jgi:hypothetical protein